MKHTFTINNPKQLENCKSIHDVRGSVGEWVSHVQIEKRNARLSCSLLVITFCFQLGHLGLLNVIRWSHMKIISLLLFPLSCFILCLRPVVTPPKQKVCVFVTNSPKTSTTTSTTPSSLMSSSMFPVVFIGCWGIVAMFLLGLIAQDF